MAFATMDNSESGTQGRRPVWLVYCINTIHSAIPVETTAARVKDEGADHHYYMGRR